MAYLSLVYSTYTAVLPSPEFGDSKKISAQGIKRLSKGGTAKVYKDSSWPVSQVSSMKFTGLVETQLYDFLELFEAAKGQHIAATDHLGNSITFIILSSSIEVLTMKDGCTYDIEFDFLATLIGFATGACLDLKVTVLPQPGDGNPWPYFATYDNDLFYVLEAEAGGSLLSETGLALYQERY